jgi:hypothetical protein
MPYDEDAPKAPFSEPFKDREKLRETNDAKRDDRRADDAEDPSARQSARSKNEDRPRGGFHVILQKLKERRARARGNRQGRTETVVHLAQYGLLLLLAPAIHHWISADGSAFRINYYVVLALTTVPTLVAASIWRPKSPLFRAAAPLLPVIAWFALRFTVANPLLLLVMLCASLGGPLVYYAVLANRVSESGEADDELEESRHPLKNIVARLHAKAHAAAAANFGAPWMAGVLLICMLIGIGLQPREERAEIGELSAAAWRDARYAENWLLEDTIVPASAMQTIARLDSALWKQLSRGEKDEALQTLLDVECANLLKNKYPPSAIDAKEVRRIASKDGKFSLSRARFSGTKADDRQVRLECVCFVAFRLWQLHTMGPDANADTWDGDAAKYAKEWANNYAIWIEEYLTGIAE